MEERMEAEALLWGHHPGLLEWALEESDKRSHQYDGTFAEATRINHPEFGRLVVSTICRPAHLVRSWEGGKLILPPGTGIPVLTRQQCEAAAEDMVNYAAHLFRLGGSQDILAAPLAIGRVAVGQGLHYLVTVTPYAGANAVEELSLPPHEELSWLGEEFAYVLQYGHPVARVISDLFTLFSKGGDEYFFEGELEVGADGHAANAAARFFDLFPALLRKEEGAIVYWPSPLPGTLAYKHGYRRAFPIRGAVETVLCSATECRPLDLNLFFTYPFRETQIRIAEGAGNRQRIYERLAEYFMGHPALKILLELNPKQREQIIKDQDIRVTPYVTRLCWLAIVSLLLRENEHPEPERLKEWGRQVRKFTSPWQYQSLKELGQRQDWVQQRLRHLNLLVERKEDIQYL